MLRCATAIVVGLMCTLSFAPEVYGGDEAPVRYLAAQAKGESSCLALRVDIPEGQALAGVSWKSNVSISPLRVMAIAPGSSGLPSLASDEMASARDASLDSGDRDCHIFTESVGSAQGTVFVVFEFAPGNSSPNDATVMGAGIGYVLDSAEHQTFVGTAEQGWTAMHPQVNLLIEPAMVDENPAVVLQSGESGGFEAAPSPGGQAAALMAEAPQLRTGLVGVAPNPFNPSTIVSFELASAGQVQIGIYNVRGARIKVIASEWLRSGRHQVTWEGEDEQGRPVSSGVYYARMTARGVSDTARLVLVK